MLLELPVAAKVIPSAFLSQSTSDSRSNPVPPLANPVVTIPAGAEPAKIYCELFAVNFLQYEGEPREYSASFAFDSERFFSRIVQEFPVISPSPSITTTWTSSNLEPLAAAYSEVPGRSAS